VKICRPATWPSAPVGSPARYRRHRTYLQVTAQTLYEAVAQALRVFREHDWCDWDLRGSAAGVLVKITPPIVEPQVRTRDFVRWLESVGKNPARWCPRSGCGKSFQDNQV